MPSAEIQFNLNGKPFVYRGEWPSEIVDAVMDAGDRLDAHKGFPASIRFDELAPICAIIKEAGGEVTLVKGLRTDGTIRAQDFPIFYAD